MIGQGFLPKWTLDVKAVEIAKSYILGQTHIECVSFTVPRTRVIFSSSCSYEFQKKTKKNTSLADDGKPCFQQLDYFQDDIYPPTRDLRQPVMEASDWIRGESKEASVLSVQPEGMKPVSEAPVEVKAKKYESRKDNEFSPEERDQRVLDNMFKNVREEAGAGPLKQDLKQGAEDSEWD